MITKKELYLIQKNEFVYFILYYLIPENIWYNKNQYLSLVLFRKSAMDSVPFHCQPVDAALGF